MATVKKEELQLEEVQQDPWKIMVDVKIPRGGRTDEKSVWFSVNDYTVSIPRGQTVKVPQPVAERVELWLQAMDAEQDFRESIPENF